MKKLITLTLCAVMALSVTACSNNNPPKKDDPQKQTSSQQIPNPWVDCQTIADANELAGFTVILPKTIPDGYTQKTIQAVKGDMVQIIYENGEDQIVFRQAKEGDDISGDLTEYKENNTLTIGSLKVTAKGNDGKINTATWINGECSFAITANPGGKGLDNQAINDMISSMDNNTNNSAVQPASPFIPFDSIADAEKLAGFTITIPSKMPEGYAPKAIEAIEEHMIQVVFEKNEEHMIVIRKAKGNSDVSGDYNQYSENKTITIGGIEVTTKGHNGKVNVATWVDSEYSYSVYAGFEGTSFDESVIQDLVSGIR